MLHCQYHGPVADTQRESSSKMYSSTIFALTQTMAEMPYSVVCATAFFLLLYYMVGLPTESGRAGYVFALVLITEIYSVRLMLLAALSCTADTPGHPRTIDRRPYPDCT
jgi:ABC-type multidrug transport system permease subunit